MTSRSSTISTGGRSTRGTRSKVPIWFILWEGMLRKSLIRMGCQILDWTWQRGWDTDFGGIFYFTSVHDMKFWWPHTKAMIATFYLTDR